MHMLVLLLFVVMHTAVLLLAVGEQRRLQITAPLLCRHVVCNSRVWFRVAMWAEHVSVTCHTACCCGSATENRLRMRVRE
jgi:hypothetical protein